MDKNNKLKGLFSGWLKFSQIKRETLLEDPERKHLFKFIDSKVGHPKSDNESEKGRPSCKK